MGGWLCTFYITVHVTANGQIHAGINATETHLINLLINLHLPVFFDRSTARETSSTKRPVAMSGRIMSVIITSRVDGNKVAER